MVENVKPKRRRTPVILALLAVLCLIATAVCFFFFRDIAYLTDSTAHVDGTITVGDNAVAQAVSALTTANPAEVIADRSADETRIAVVFVGLTEDADTNHAVLELSQREGWKASFALSAAEALEYTDFVADMKTAGFPLLSNGAAGESNLQSRPATEEVRTMLTSRQILENAVGQAVPLLYCSSTTLTGDVLRAASVSGYEAVLSPETSHVITRTSFTAQADAHSFVSTLQGDCIVVVNLRGNAEKIQDEDSVTAAKPAVDKMPHLDITTPETATATEPVSLLLQVQWLAQALDQRDIATEYAGSFTRTDGLLTLQAEAEEPQAAMAAVYRSCLTDKKQAGLGVAALPSAEEMDTALAALDSTEAHVTFFATEEELQTRTEDLQRLVDAGCTLGLTLPAIEINGLARGEIFARLYTASRTLAGTKGSSGLLLVDADYDADTLAALRAVAKVLNLRVTMPASPEKMEAGSLYLLSAFTQAETVNLQARAADAGLQLVDLGTSIANSGSIPSLTPTEVNTLRKQNENKQAEIQTMIYTEEHCDALARYGAEGKTAAVSTVEKMQDSDSKGTFFFTLTELMQYSDGIEEVVAQGNSIGIAYKVTDDYPQTFNAVSNYIHSWRTYAAWRYGVDSVVVLLPGVAADNATKEAISACGCKLAQIVFGTFSNGIVIVPASAAVSKDYFDSVTFLGDSLTQGMQQYSTGLPNAMYCAYKGIGPNAVANGVNCVRADGVSEVPLKALKAQNPKAVYIMLGTNALVADGDYSPFLSYYRLMMDALAQVVPDATVYIQSIPPVRPSVKDEHPGLNRDRLQAVNKELALIAQEKNCYYLDLWEVLADENGDLKKDIAQEDGYHLKPDGYTLWVSYLCNHTVQ